MKKLRVALIVLFAMLMSLALFACQNDNPDQPINPDDEAPAGQVDTVKAGAIQLDDQDQAKDLTDALNALDVTVTYDNDAQGKPVAAKTLRATTENFEIDSSALKFDEKGIAVGAYTVVITPKADNFYKATGNVVVNVEHNFQQEGDSLICKKDGATQTNVTFDTPVELGLPKWGNATTSKNLNAYVKAFGTVGSGASVNTFTVGRLDKGMTIKVTGTAIHDTESGSGDANACFPILGFADRDLTADGAGWLQRNDYYAIFNGVNDGTLSGFKTLGATQANATDGTEATDLLKPVVSGTSSQTDAYETEAEVEFTWNYSSDCVATVEWYTPGNGRRWTAKCLMPDKQSYESVLHGEAVKMTIKSIAITQSLKLESIDTPAVKTGTKMLENTYFDKTALSFKAHYAGGFESVPDVAVMTVYGSTTEGLTNDNMNGETVVWNNLSTTKLSKKFKSFKVAVSMGSTTCEGILPANSFEIIANAVDHASPNEVTLTGATNTTATFITGIDAIDFTSADSKPTLIVRGNALSLSADQKQVLGTTAATHSVAFSIYQFGETKFENGNITIEGTDDKGTEAAVVGKAIVAANGKSVDVVLAITKNTKSVTIKGVQAADIVVNFTEQAVDGQGTAYESVLVLGRPIPSVMTASYEQKLNRKQETVTIVYNLGDRANGLTAQSLSSEFKFTVNDNSATYFNAEGNGANNGDRNPANVGNMPGIQNMKVKSLTFSESAKTITIVYEVPAFNPEAPISYKFALEDMKKSNEILAVDYLYYVPEFDTTPAEGETGYAIAENLYASVQGTTLYISMANKSTNLWTNTLSMPLSLKVNAGTDTPAIRQKYDYLQAFDLSYAYTAAGAVSFTGTIPFEDLATVSGSTFGTLNNPDNTDRGAVTVVAFNVAKLGYTATSTYYFEINYSDKLFKVENGKVSLVSGDYTVGEAKNLGTPTCSETTTSVKPVTLGGKEIYWKDAALVLNTHTWGTPGADGWASCTNNCGAKKMVMGTEPLAKIDVAPVAGAKEKGLTIAYEAYNKAHGLKEKEEGYLACGDWSAHIINPYKNADKELTGLLVTGENLDPFANTVGLTAVNAFPTKAGAKTTSVYQYKNMFDVAAESAAKVMIMIDETNGVRYYLNGQLAVHYPAGMDMEGATVGDFVKQVLSYVEEFGFLFMGNKEDGVVAKSLVYFAGVGESDVSAGAFAAGIFGFPAPAPANPTLPTNPVVNVTDESNVTATVGTADHALGFTAKGPVVVFDKVEAGHSLTIEGNISSTATFQWETLIVNLYGENSGDWTLFRCDGFADTATSYLGDAITVTGGCDTAIGNYPAEGNEDAQQDTAYLNLIKNGKVKVTIDYTQASNLVVSVEFTAGDASRTITFSLTNEAGLACGAYYVGFGGEHVYVSGMTVTRI